MYRKRPVIFIRRKKEGGSSPTPPTPVTFNDRWVEKPVRLRYKTTTGYENNYEYEDPYLPAHFLLTPHPAGGSRGPYRVYNKNIYENFSNVPGLYDEFFTVPVRVRSSSKPIDVVAPTMQWLPNDGVLGLSLNIPLSYCFAVIKQPISLRNAVYRIIDTSQTDNKKCISNISIVHATDSAGWDMRELSSSDNYDVLTRISAKLTSIGATMTNSNNKVVLSTYEFTDQELIDYVNIYEGRTGTAVVNSVVTVDINPNI